MHPCTRREKRRVLFCKRSAVFLQNRQKYRDKIPNNLAEGRNSLALLFADKQDILSQERSLGKEDAHAQAWHLLFLRFPKRKERID